MQHASSSSSSIPTTRRRPRPPAPGETLVPRGFEQVAHPVFTSCPIPLEDVDTKKRPTKISFAPFEATDEALSIDPLQQKQRAAPPPAPAAEEDGKLLASRMGEMDDDIHCAICLEEYTEPSVVVTNKCLHTYCKACITRWLSMNQPSSSSFPSSSTSSASHGPSCPLCKRAVTWLLSISASSNPTPPFRFVLVAVGTDVAELEKQPWPSPGLLQGSRQRQLDLYEARQRKHEQEKRQEEHEKKLQKRAAARKRKKEKEEEEEEEEEGGTKIDDRPLTERLQDELQRVDKEIAYIKTGMLRNTHQRK